MGRNLRRPYVVGVLLFRSWDTAVTSWAGAKGLDNMMLFGTPFEAQSSALSPLMYTYCTHTTRTA